MREILFRGKRIDNGEWVEGGYYVIPDGEGGAIHRIAVSDCERFEYNDVVVDPSSISEFTGLTDKNGKKIFEGDIVGTRIWSEWDDTTVWREGPVIFENGGFFIKTSDTLHVAIGEERYEKPYFKIFGNIYDNPELLEDKIS